MSTWLPSVNDILVMHQRLVDRFGGHHGIRDLGLIESALARASASFGGTDAYPDIVGKAAALGCGLTQNHGFVDGNKRIGMAMMLVTLRANGISPHCTSVDIIHLGLSVAQGTMDSPEVAAWLRAHIAE